MKIKRNALGTAQDRIPFKFQLKMKRNWSQAAQDRIWLVSIAISFENDKKLICGSRGHNLIRTSIENQNTLIEGRSTQRKSGWCSPGPNLINFYIHFHWRLKKIGLRQTTTESYSNFSWKLKKLGLRQPFTECDWFLFQFQLKMKGSSLEAPRARI